MDRIREDPRPPLAVEPPRPPIRLAVVAEPHPPTTHDAIDELPDDAEPILIIEDEPETAVASPAPGVRREYFEPGQAVFQEGDRGDWLYVVTEGEVEVLKQNGGGTATSLRRLGPGECFGEIALVSDQPRTATVRAVTATNVLAVDREAFQALFATLPPLRGFVETLIAGRDR